MAKLTVVGLGYVGLPLAVAFGCKGHEVIGFDVQEKKLKELDSGFDAMGEVSSEQLKKANIKYTSQASDIVGCEYIVIAVPTPVDSHHRPDLTPILKASEAIAPQLKDNVIVIYESTVYPGVTEEECLPVLEAANKKQNIDFRLGYSPERINPGDKEHTIDKIIKVVSGQDAETLDAVAELYESIVDAGVHRAESIMVAEAAKVIENTQRDLNIALMNELSIIFDRMNIRTRDVLRAAGTKWNFLNFYPGLVGGHCIGVDPYYLTYRAQSLGYTAEVITAGRKINDGMGKRVAEKVIKMLIKSKAQVMDSNVLVLGMTFKENVPDFRNSKVVDVVKELQDYGVNVHAHDPFMEEGSVFHDINLKCINLEKTRNIDAVILAVGHKEYKKLSAKDFAKFYKSNGNKILIDIPAILAEEDVSDYSYWQL